MKTVIVIAQNTFRETIRDRILYAILGFGIIFLLFDIFLGQLALGDIVAIRSFGLAGIYIFGLVITIFLGASIIYKEIERHTLYFILSKPVSRSSVILGKFLGLYSAVIVTTLLMFLVYASVIFYHSGGFYSGDALAVFYEILEEGLFTAMLVFFSSLVRPLSATLSATLLLFAGHLLPATLESARLVGGATYKVLQAVYYLLPNLEKFNIRNLVVHNIHISLIPTLFSITYMVFYSTLLIFSATMIFKKREL